MASGSVLLVGGSVAASSLVADFPVFGGQGVRYLVAGLLLAVWAGLRREPLLWPTRREWAWLGSLAAVGLAGLSVVLVEATRVTDPAGVGVIIGAAPMAIVLISAAAARRRPSRRVLGAAALVTVGSAAAQLSGVSGASWSWSGLVLSVAALGGVVATSLFAAPALPRLGALAVTIYSCVLAGIGLLGFAGIMSWTNHSPILRMPTAVELGALAYLAVAVTAVVFLAWYGALARLGVEKTGLFNGLIPIASLVAVALVGTGTVTPLRTAGAVAVLLGVALGLTGTRAGSSITSDRHPNPSLAGRTGSMS